MSKLSKDLLGAWVKRATMERAGRAPHGVLVVEVTDVRAIR